MAKDAPQKRFTLDGLPSEPLVHDLTPTTRMMNTKLIGIAMVIILIGVASGWFLARKDGGSTVGMLPGDSAAPSGSAKVGQIVGSKDTKTFSDNAEGQLQDGGLDGEGTHHLERPGGPSQTVYLTSSVLDLSQFIGKKVRVWGETHAAKKAGWLMDVGKVEVLQ